MFRYAPIVALLLSASAVCAQTVGKTVPGTSDPWLAGMPPGATASSGDTAPAQSPVLVDGAVNVALGGSLTFVVTGEVSNTGTLLGITPDGQAPVAHGAGAENGIADVTAPLNSLIGVFLDATQPDLAGPVPTALTFVSAGQLSYATLSPGLRQPFFIGDGLTGTATGARQVVNIPAGATRLFLGTMDGFGWFNNAGQFNVTVTQSTAAPPPSQAAAVPLTIAPLMALVLGAIGFAELMRRRRAR